MKYLSILLLCISPILVFSQDEDKSKKKEKKYKDVITDKMVSDEGLFTIRKECSMYYFEFPMSKMCEEILVVSRISGHVRILNLGGVGMK